MSDVTDHKACPFCGGNDLRMIETEDGWPCVQCLDCGAQGPCVKIQKSEAWQDWDRRAAAAIGESMK